MSGIYVVSIVHECEADTPEEAVEAARERLQGQELWAQVRDERGTEWAIEVWSGSK